MAVRIITDSSCDHPFSKQQEWDIDIHPFHVFFGDDEYIDGQNLEGAVLRADEIDPRATETAQITVEFEEIFKKYLEAGDGLWCSRYPGNERHIQQH